MTEDICFAFFLNFREIATLQVNIFDSAFVHFHNQFREGFIYKFGLL